MQTLPPQEQFAFFFTVEGTGGGQNDLVAQVINDKFAGDMAAYNSWINDNTYGTNGYVNNISFNPATGALFQSGAQIDQLSGWTCPFYP
jgi:hypothetical protein